MRQLLASMNGLPGWVKIWMPMLFGTNMMSIAFLDNAVGRWTAISFAAVCAFNMPMMIVQKGLTRLLALPHFLWLPLVVYLSAQLYGQDPLPPGGLRVYATAVLALNATSLLFDGVEAYRWLKGEREVLGLTCSAARAA